MDWLIGLLVVIALLLAYVGWQLELLRASLEGYKRQFTAAMGDGDQIYLRTVAQRAKGEPYYRFEDGPPL